MYEVLLASALAALLSTHALAQTTQGHAGEAGMHVNTVMPGALKRRDRPESVQSDVPLSGITTGINHGASSDTSSGRGGPNGSPDTSPKVMTGPNAEPSTSETTPK